MNKMEINKSEIMKFIKFMGIGTLGSVIDYTLMILLKEIVGIPVLISSGIAFSLTLIYIHILWI